MSDALLLIPWVLIGGILFVGIILFVTALAHDLYEKVKAVPQEAKEAAVKEATKHQDIKEKEVKESVQAPPLTSQAASLEESRDAKRGEMLDLAVDTADAMDALSVLQEAAQGMSVEAVEEAADEDGEDESEENEETSLLSDLLGSSDDED